jgi:hypothetical protein
MKDSTDHTHRISDRLLYARTMVLHCVLFDEDPVQSYITFLTLEPRYKTLVSLFPQVRPCFCTTNGIQKNRPLERFPFMTAPRTNYYSAQLQSCLFRFPCEVRDAIYAYYVLGEEGYHHDSEIGKMLYTTEPKQTVRLGLVITCRNAHEELKHMVLRKINSRSHSSNDDGRSYMGLSSRAGRFKCSMSVFTHELMSSCDRRDVV